MPELPEAETIVRGLRTHILNRRIVSINFPRARYFRPTLEHPLEHYLGSRIVDIFRHGKSVIFQIQQDGEGDEFILVRLGMTGQLLLGSSVDRHTHAIFTLDPGRSSLCFRDHRQFGRIYFLRDWRLIFDSRKAGSHEPKDDSFRMTGAKSRTSLPWEPQPVADPLKITDQEFLKIFWKRHGMMKSALMSQKLLVGVGNIYADESLFAARIHPRQNICRLSRPKLLRYFMALVKTLNKAIRLGGSTISDFVGPTNSYGEFQLAHKVYGRTGEKCRRRGCGGIIKRIIVASRSTHFCPKCQRPV